jgi:hypothetical protein
MTPSKLNRRDFLKSSSLAGVALAAPSIQVLGANDEIRLAVIAATAHHPREPQSLDGEGRRRDR